MVLALDDDQGGPLPAWQDVLDEVGAVDRLPDGEGGRDRLVVGQRGIPVEVGIRVGERGGAQGEEPVDVPPFDVRHPRVDIDREVEEVAHGQARPAHGAHRGGAQDVEAFDDEDIGLTHDHSLAGDDVIGQVRIDRRRHFGPPTLDLGEEPQQCSPVVGLWKTLAVHEPSAPQLSVGQQEPVGGDELHVGGRRPPAEQLAQDAGGRRLADGDRSGDADDERGLLPPFHEEVARHTVQLLNGLAVEGQQAREWEVDLLDLPQVQRVVQAAQPGQVVGGDLQRVVLG